jgi:hypothetical protein
MRVTAAEKQLVILLAKLANPAPGHSGIGKQRREMIDASDALSSKDGSIVSVVELRRLIAVCQELFTTSGQSVFLVTQEVKAFIDAMHAILAAHRLDSTASLSDEQRKVMTELLEQTAGAYRWCYNHQGFSGHLAELRTQHVLALLDLVQRYANQILGAQPGSDGAMRALAIPNPYRETERSF